MNAYEIIENKLRAEMVPGQMHGALRDLGRLAGGYLSAGKLKASDVAALENVAASLSKNPKEGVIKWRAAVEFGRRDPIRTETNYNHAKEIGWNDPIYTGKQAAIVDENWIESMDIEIPELKDWNAVEDLVQYLTLLFEPDEHVGYVADAWKPEGSDKWVPSKGVSDRSRDDLVKALMTCKGDIGKVIGDTRPDVGAWVRINPLDNSGGAKDANVVAFRHALIEADDQDLGKQLALIRELQLPCSAIVHSGGKSIHAIVRVDAADATDYRAKVDQLYEICLANGLKVDQQNRNPSRLSRLPGVTRNGVPQFLISGRCGQANFAAWLEHIEEEQDDLPDPQQLPATSDDLPALAPELIKGLLREGHKMRISGPSKAGKSFALIHLSIAVAEGKRWMGFDCAQGPSLYVNLELDGRSCLHRFHAVYDELGWEKTNIAQIDIWNLRGHVVPLESLAPKLIRRAKGRGYKMVILDPIYKIQTGDENDAGDIAKFCNALDRICNEIGAAVVDCHHHSKGLQGQKRAMDRASGSGVFGRDPDAVLDLIELKLAQSRQDGLTDTTIRLALDAFAAENKIDMDLIPLEDLGPAPKLVKAMQHIAPAMAREIAQVALQARERSESMSGWRLEGSLREFKAFKPRNIWFDYPIHREDDQEILADAKAEGEEPPWMEAQKEKQEAKEQKREMESKALLEVIKSLGGVNIATVSGVAEHLGIDPDTVRNRIKKYTSFTFKKGIIFDTKNEVKNDD